MYGFPNVLRVRAEMSEAVFQAPKRRARVYEAYEAPFPVLLTAEDAKLPVDLVYRAEIVNKNVIVRDPDHIQALYGKVCSISALLLQTCFDLVVFRKTIVVATVFFHVMS